MQQQQIKTSHDLEDIYVRSVNAPQTQPVDPFTIAYNNTKDDATIKIDSSKFKKTQNTGLPRFSKDSAAQSSENDFIEVRTFLPTKLNKMISSRYENPLTQLKGSTKRWKALTYFLTLFSIVYFSLNLWATMSLFDWQISTKAPRPLIEVSSMLIQMQDIMFYHNTINLVMDIFALVIYIGLAIVLLRQSTAYIEKSFAEKGRFERMMIRVLVTIVILFGLSYIAGTIFLLIKAHKHISTGDLVSLFIFHISKVICLLLNVFAFKKYRSKKYVYEDLLLEALEPSGIADEKSEVDEHNTNNFEHHPRLMRI